MTLTANAPARAIDATGGSKARLVRSPGGIEAWLVEEHAVPLVAIDFAFIGGAAQDAPGKAGTAHLLSGLLDEGAGKLDAAAFQEAVADKAIQIEFHASHDFFSGAIRTLARYREDAVELAKLALTQARLDAEPLARVRAGILAELKSEANDPGKMAARLFRETAFAGHAYGLPTRGDLKSVAAIRRDDLVAARARIFARSNLRVAVVGAIDADTLAATLDTLFGELPAAPDLAPVPATVSQGTGRLILRDLDVPQTYFRFGRPGIAWTDPDFMAASVVDHILGGGSFTSRLWTEIRETRGLTYGIGTRLDVNLAADMQAGSTFTKNERARELYDVLTGEYARMAAEGPTDEEVEKAKTYLAGSYPLGFDTSWKIANRLLNHALFDLGIDYVDRYRDLVAAVTPDDARRVAKRLYGDGSLLIAMAGRPQGLPDSLETA